jgi:hypothetical protein
MRVASRLNDIWQTIVQARTSVRVWFIAPRSLIDAFFNLDALPYVLHRFVLTHDQAARLPEEVGINVEATFWTRDNVQFSYVCSEEWIEVLRESFPGDLFVNLLKDE